MSEEKILCAAVKYNNHAVPGRRHNDCYMTLHLLTGEALENLPGREAQGFLTTIGRYVSRKEAYQIARANNQLRMPHVDGCMELLTSEDLY
jgi:hypothetical protein